MPSILLLEDEFLIRMVLAEELRDMGYAVHEAATPDEAFAAPFEDMTLLITDVAIGSRISGWDVALRARAKNPDIKVIYLTGYLPDEARAVPGGVILTKPCPMPQMCAALAKLGLPTAAPRPIRKEPAADRPQE